MPTMTLYGHPPTSHSADGPFLAPPAQDFVVQNDAAEHLPTSQPLRTTDPISQRKNKIYQSYQEFEGNFW